MDGITRAEALALLKVDSADASQHARCGPKALCRVNALARCDEDLDAYLDAKPLALQRVRDVGAGSIAGG